MNDMTRSFGTDHEVAELTKVTALGDRVAALSRQSSTLVHNSERLRKDSTQVRDRIEAMRLQLQDLYRRLSEQAESHGV